MPYCCLRLGRDVYLPLPPWNASGITRRIEHVVGSQIFVRRRRRGFIPLALSHTGVVNSLADVQYRDVINIVAIYDWPQLPVIFHQVIETLLLCP